MKSSFAQLVAIICITFLEIVTRVHAQEAEVQAIEVTGMASEGILRLGSAGRAVRPAAVDYIKTEHRK